MQQIPPRKIIHIDMDCFYAAIEERDNPELRGKPVGVGGSSRRGVLTTANYEARKFGCRSAMPVFMALEKCPELLIVPTRFDVYKRDSTRIREVFARFTPLIEPLSLDEAFLDVSHIAKPGTIIASRIRQQIREETGLTAFGGNRAEQTDRKDRQRLEESRTGSSAFPSATRLPS